MMMSGTISSNIDALTFDRKKINTLLDQSSKYYTSAYAHLTDMEDRVKKKHAELYLHFKTDATKRSAEEIKALIITDASMDELTKELSQAKTKHLNCKVDWDKLKTKIMLLQSEVRQNLEFNKLSEG
tara:strand:+ start:2784 stop:3164 length:381 start_codon:yes stop_codon:yes gene_type:complete